MLHHEPTRSRRAVQPSREVPLKSSPPTSPGALRAPRQQLTERPRGDISPIGSPLPEPVFTPGTDAFSNAFQPQVPCSLPLAAKEDSRQLTSALLTLQRTLNWLRLHGL